MDTFEETPKKNLFYLNFIKVIACWAVFTIHFNAHTSKIFTLQRFIFPNHIFNGVYLGTFGVSLFFMASGAGLYNSWSNEENHSIIRYYKKRLSTLFPMYWIAYIWAAIACLFVFKKYSTASIKFFPLTVIGMDGYLQGLNIITDKCFYLVGEWFLGCILIIYIISPILLKSVEKNAIITFITVETMGLLCNINCLPFYFHSDIWFIRRLPEFVLGMLIVKYLKKININTIFVGILLLIIFVNSANYIPDKVLYDTIVCFSCFLILMGFSKFLENSKFENIITNLSKYTYAVFLTHDYIIFCIVTYFNLDQLQLRDLIILYLAFISITTFFTKHLFNCEKKVKFYYRKIKKIIIDYIKK